MKKGNRPARRKISPLGYVFISLAAFLIGVALLFVLVFNAKELMALGLGLFVYYVVLIAIGLAAAGFLFGVMNSVASYKGLELSGSLEIRGPAVVFLLVVILGFVLPPSGGEPFDFTVRLRGIDGAAVLKGEGSLRMILGTDTKTVDLDKQGQVIFAGIPAGFKNQPVRLELDAPGWRFVKDDKNDGQKLALSRPLTGTQATLAVEPDNSLSLLRVSVLDEDKRAVSGAIVLVEGERVGLTDAFGMLTVTLPMKLRKPELSLSIHKQGFKVWEGNAFPATGAQVKALLETED
jgi:hypothetical protein